MQRLSFLHTVDSNRTLFDQIAKEVGFLQSNHQVRPDLLAQATALGFVDRSLETEVKAALERGLEDADLAFLTCSSIGSVADILRDGGRAVLRTDQLLADAVITDALASGQGSAIAVLVAAPTSVEPTTTLFKARQAALSADPLLLDVLLLPSIWDHFLAGNVDHYQNALFEAVQSFVDEHPVYSHIALGQASMAKAADQGMPMDGRSIWTIPSATRHYLDQLAAQG